MKSARDLLTAARIARLLFAELRWLHFYSLAARLALPDRLAAQAAKTASVYADALDAIAEERSQKTNSAIAAILQESEDAR